MAEGYAAALAQTGLGWIVLAAFLGGLARGFTGFGTAMIFMPVAALFLPPLEALVALAVMDIFGPLPNVGRAWRDSERGDLGRLVGGMMIVLPLGLALVAQLPQETFRVLVSGLSLVLVAVLAGGLRYRGPFSPGLVWAAGGTGGLTGGLAGIPGPPVILLYMASPKGISVIRANTLLFLCAYDVLIVLTLALAAALTAKSIVLGLVLAVPALAGNVLGARLFRPERVRIFRLTVYAFIVGAAITGLLA